METQIWQFSGGKDDKKKKKEDAAAKPLKDKDGNVLKWVDRAPTYHEIANIRIDLKPLLSCEQLFSSSVSKLFLHSIRFDIYMRYAGLM